MVEAINKYGWTCLRLSEGANNSTAEIEEDLPMGNKLPDQSHWVQEQDASSESDDELGRGDLYFLIYV